MGRRGLTGGLLGLPHSELRPEGRKSNREDSEVCSRGRCAGLLGFRGLGLFGLPSG